MGTQWMEVHGMQKVNGNNAGKCLGVFITRERHVCNTQAGTRRPST